MSSAPVLAVVVAAAALAAAPALAVTVTSAPGAPDSGPGPGEIVFADFDHANAAGVAETSWGAVITAAGSVGGVRAAPAGTAPGGVYRSIGGGSGSTFDLSGLGGGRPLKSFSLYWGSVDSYNYVDLLDARGAVVRTVGGADLPLYNGDQTAAASNRRVFFGFVPGENISQVRLRSDGAAFEVDTLAAAPGMVPEPSSWALLIAGFGLVGAAMRRQRRMVAA